MHSIFDRMRESDIRREPFPYAVIENALPPDYYEMLAASFPATADFGREGELGNNKLHHLASRDVLDDISVPEIWREFIAYHSSADFFRKICRIWGKEIETSRRELLQGYDKPLAEFSVGRRVEGKRSSEGNQNSDIVLDCQFSINSPVTELSSVRGPHLDSPFKLFAALLYFRDPEDDSSGGDFEVYRLKPYRLPLPKPSKVKSGYVELIERVRYAPNTLVFFVNTRHAYHGVTPRTVTRRPRRYINFLGECYAGNRDGFLSPTNPNIDPKWRAKLTKAYRYKWALGL